MSIRSMRRHCYNFPLYGKGLPIFPYFLTSNCNLYLALKLKVSYLLAISKLRDTMQPKNKLFSIPHGGLPEL